MISIGTFGRDRNWVLNWSWSVSIYWTHTRSICYKFSVWVTYNWIVLSHFSTHNSPMYVLLLSVWQISLSDWRGILIILRSVSSVKMMEFMLGGECCMLMQIRQGILNKTYQLLSWIYVSSWAISIRSCRHACYAIGGNCVVMSWTDELIRKNYKASRTTTLMHACLFIFCLMNFWISSVR